MRNYEITFIVDPILSRDEIKSTARSYVDHLKSEGAEIVHVDEMGLRQLAYPINKRTTGEYFCVEFAAPNGVLIAPMELVMRRDDRIIRFLTVSLDKYGVQYNEDKRAGKIGKVKKKEKKEEKRDNSRGRNKRRGRNDRNSKPRENNTPVAAPERKKREAQATSTPSTPKSAVTTAAENQPVPPPSNDEEE
ncbi:MAG: 30S ribosomal protein S6 [Saprospiraceae bacterium]